MGTDLQAIWDALREKLRLILLCVVAALLLGVVHLSRSPAVYRAEAVLQVEQEERGMVLSGARAEDLRGVEILMTIEQNLTSPALLMNVIEAGGLSRNPAFLPEVRRPASSEMLQSVLSRRIRAKVRPGSRLIDISVEDRSPELAKKLVHLVIEEFMRQGFKARMAFSQMEHEFMAEEAGRLRARLETSEESLQNYREKTHSVSLEDKENIVVAKLKELNLRVTEAKTARLRLETDNALLSQMTHKEPERLLTIASVANSTPVLELQKSIQVKEAEIGTLRKRYKPLHPKYIVASSELAQLREGLDEALVKGAESVAQLYDSAVATERRLEKALMEQEGIALELSKKAIAYSALNSEVQADRALYESVLKRLKETDITRNIAQTAVRVVSPPIVLGKPVKPLKKRAMLLSLVGGLGLGCALALLGRSLDRSLRTVDETELLLEEIQALAVIPLARRVRSLAEGLPLLTEPGSNVAESFRTLRTSLSLMNRTTSGRTILFTSAVPGEGKSFCAINTAVAYAQQGVSTLLIDADLRLPSVCSVFFGGKKIAGLSDILSDGVAPAGIVRPSGIENLSILSSGSQGAGAAELLAQEDINQVIRWARRNYQCVVIDSAPVNAVSDTLLVVQHVEITCLVIRADSTPANAVLAAVRKLRKAGATVEGFVLNGVRRYRTDDYSSYYKAAYEKKVLEIGAPVAELTEGNNR